MTIASETYTHRIELLFWWRLHEGFREAFGEGIDSVGGENGGEQESGCGMWGWEGSKDSRDEDKGGGGGGGGDGSSGEAAATVAVVVVAATAVGRWRCSPVS